MLVSLVAIVIWIVLDKSKETYVLQATSLVVIMRKHKNQKTFTHRYHKDIYTFYFHRMKKNNRTLRENNKCHLTQSFKVRQTLLKSVNYQKLKSF